MDGRHILKKDIHVYIHDKCVCVLVSRKKSLIFSFPLKTETFTNPFLNLYPSAQYTLGSKVHLQCKLTGYAFTWLL